MLISIPARNFYALFIRRKRFFIVAAFTLVSLVLSIRAWNPHNLSAEAANGNDASKLSGATELQSRSGDRVEVEFITLGTRGFEPTEITRPAGRVLLAINNNTNLDEVAFRLQRERGAKLHEERIPKKQNLRKVINFTPGNYILRELNHPGWVCRITITN